MDSNLSDISIISLSNDYLVIDKPFDMLINHNFSSQTCEPKGEAEKVTVHTVLKTRFPHLNNSRLKHGFHFLHRLDYSTSGILCIGLNKPAAQSAAKAFADRMVDKYYVAIVRGHIEGENVLQMDSGIGEDGRPNRGHCMCTEDKDYCVRPRSALTRLLVLQLGSYDGEPASKVLLKPVSGRRHQLRVHCHSIGHPIVGDYTYSEGKDDKPHRMFLHSIRLTIPLQSETLDFTTPDPFADVNEWRAVDIRHQCDHRMYHLI